MQNSHKYLPLKQFHIVSLTGLSSEEIKKSAKYANRDREKISHNTKLNAIVKSLGFKGGFSEYQKSHYKNLELFLRDHGLSKRTNLFKLRNKAVGVPISQINPQNLSERIFYSGLEIPKKVFTGYDYDFKARMEEGNLELIRSAQDLGELPYGLQRKREVRNDIETNIHIARKHPHKKISLTGRFNNRSLIDVVLGNFIGYGFGNSFHLLGDFLISPIQNPFTVPIYPGTSDKETFQEEKDLLIAQLTLFRERIDQGEEGWVEIIPFNKNLVFVKGRNGEFDFVFKDQKDKSFDHQIYGDALKRADIPSFIQDYVFDRWHYFEYKGWREKDTHEAENLYYQKKREGSDYPGIDVLLKKFYKKIGVFSPSNKKSSFKHPDFFPVEARGIKLMVSNLISIKDLSDFLIDRSDYLGYREGGDLITFNEEADYTLPVGTTLFDTYAFIKWYEDKHKLPVRLLKYEEYIEIRGEESLLDPQDILSVEEFKKRSCRFNNPIKWYEQPGGLKYVLSNNFGEWLFEKTCIRTGSLLDFNTGTSVIRSRPQPDSLGTYKGLKIGFRLCYELDTPLFQNGGAK